MYRAVMAPQQHKAFATDESYVSRAYHIWSVAERATHL